MNKKVVKKKMRKIEAVISLDNKSHERLANSLIILDKDSGSEICMTMRECVAIQKFINKYIG